MASSATVRVEKATSDLLIGPDWTMNMDICDFVNCNSWQSKDVLKAVKKRLQHKSSNVQLLTLTLLETLMKNCGDIIHFQIFERKILQEMIKIVKKKTDMRVRDKILALIDSWQEAFGGPGGKYPHYYWAYDELRHSGIEFPKRSLDVVPMFTPPVSNPSFRYDTKEHVPTHSSQRLHEAMASEVECITSSSLVAMEDAMDLLAEMLQAVKPTDPMAVEDEVIVDLVDQCRANQKNLIQMLTTTVDEDLLGRGLELNDRLQNSLGRYDAISSGSLVHEEAGKVTSRSVETSGSSISPSLAESISKSSMTANALREEEEEEDDFTQLARRHSGKQPIQDSDAMVENIQRQIPSTSITRAPSEGPSSRALATLDPPLPVKTSNEDIIDLLTTNLSLPSPSPHNPHNLLIPGPSPNREDLAQSYLQNGSYVAPWARQPPLEVPHPRPELHPQFPSVQLNPPVRGYPPPPWETALSSDQTATPGGSMAASYTQPLQHHNSLSAKGSSVPPGPKPFVPSYRLFEDLDVFRKSRDGGNPGGLSEIATLSVISQPNASERK